MFRLVCMVSCLLAVCLAKDLILENRRGDGSTIYVGTLSNALKAPLANGGFALGPGETRTVNAPEDWAGRFWGRTGCNFNGGGCETGDCGRVLECNGAGGAPPASLAEFTFAGWGGNDYYDISLVDGSNVPISIYPTNPVGNPGDQYRCAPARCEHDFNQDCPNELRLYNGNGQTVGCKSACAAFNTEVYCCSGSHNTPETCKSSDWPVNYPQFFKERCPEAYSYAYDDHKSTFTCANTNYRIVFT